MRRSTGVLIFSTVLATMLLGAKPVPTAQIPQVRFSVAAHMVAPGDEDRVIYMVWHLECGDGQCNLSFAQITDCIEILVGSFTTESTVLSVTRSDDGKALIAQVRVGKPGGIVLRFEGQGTKLVGFSGSQTFDDGRAVTFVPIRHGESKVPLSCALVLPALP